MNEFKIKKGLIVNGSGSTILDIQGSQGQLFSVTDSLSGSLFSVNDISGIPIMEVFSDDTINLGTFGNEAIKVSGSFATMTGSLFGTASWAENATTASFASTASFVSGGITGTGTSGQVSFFTGTTTQAGDNGLFWDNTNKRLGIGTTSPSSRLQVRGTGTTASTVALRVENNNGSGSLIVNDAGDVYNNGVQGVTSNTFFGENVGRVATGDNNSAFGLQALRDNTTGLNNSAFGVAALPFNTVGTDNSAFGVAALLFNTTGNNNSAFGLFALQSNTAGGFNSAFGVNALRDNTTGGFNSAFGLQALRSNTTGGNNIGLGLDAGRRIANGSNNTITNNSIYIGVDTRAAADNQTNQIVIGHNAIGLGSNTTVLGNSSTVTTALYGNVGIGTTSPTSRLGITSTANQTALGITGYSLTGANAQSALDISGTWNTTGAPTAIRLNVTDTNSSGNSLLMDLQQNGTSRFRVRRDGLTTINNNLICNNINLGTNNVVISQIGIATTVSQNIFSAIPVVTGISGIYNIFNAQSGLNVTSGDRTYTSFNSNPTINQTGGANGITRGLLINPSLTSAFDWRSIEWSNNTGWGLYGVGTANNYLNGKLLLGTTIDNGTDRLQVSGSVNITSIPTRTTPATIFLTTDNNQIRSRTAEEVRSDIGAVIEGTQYVFVYANGTDVENATELQAAYDLAKTMSPSATNRITVIAAPGNYNFGTSAFVMDTQYIDLVSLDGNRSVIFNSSNAAGTISITANDVFVKGVDVLSKNFTIGDTLSLLKVENCKGGTFSFGGDPSFGSNPIRVTGTFTDCEGGSDSFGGSGQASGTFINCTGDIFSFSGNFGIASGTFINCTGRSFSFGGSGDASGTFTNCQGGNSSFGGSGDASGTFTNCQGGDNSFGGNGGQASGVFIDCIGAVVSFGGQGGTASGTFTNCQGGFYSFGGDSGTASGTFTNCIGEDESFGFGGTLSGKLYYCRLTSGTFETPSGTGKIVLGIDGNDDVINL